MSDRLRGRIGVVTGAGRGIGRQIATSLAAEGMSLLVLSRTGAEVRSLAEDLTTSYDVPVLPAAVDVTDAAAVDRVVMHAEQQLGTVDLLVNNAARIESTELAFWESDVEDAWDVVTTNLRGPMLMTRALLPPMVARGHGRVINVTSLARGASRTGTYTGYAVSKRGLSVLTQTLAAALAGTGVTVVDLLPGLVRTGMTETMPVWQDPSTEWDDAAASGRLAVDIALGRYDDRSGELLEAPGLDDDPG